MRFAVAFWTLFFFFSLQPLKAEETSNLEHIRLSIEKNEDILKKNLEEQQRLEKKIVENAKQLAELQRRSQNLTAESQRIKNDLDLTQQEIKKLTKKQKKLKKDSFNRLRAIYMKKYEISAAKVAAFSDLSKIARNIFFFSKFFERDKNLLIQFSEIKRQKKDAKSKFSKLLQNKDLLKAELNSNKAEITKKINDEKRLRGNLQQEQKHQLLH